jgi:hypothetical protein
MSYFMLLFAAVKENFISRLYRERESLPGVLNAGELKLFPESDNGPLIQGKINISEALQPLDCSMCKNAIFENRITVCRPLDKHTPS